MTFAQILGHERQKDILRRALRSDRLAHAYLFEGPEGVGKRLMAMALARAVFCVDGVGCGDCLPCRKVDHGNHPDLQLIEPEGTGIKIDQVRAIQRELSFRPLESSRKICVIEAADRLNTAAANSLLKTLEEPPPAALLILLSPHPERLLPTIRSRCQRLPFTRLPAEQIRQVLIERMGCSDTEGHVLSMLSEGSFKKALGRDRELFLERRREILKALAALNSASILPLLSLAEELAADKERLPDVLDILQAFYRDLLLYGHGRPEDELVNIDLIAKIQRLAAVETPHSLLRKLEAIAEGRRQLERNVNRQLSMEVLLLRLAA